MIAISIDGEVVDAARATISVLDRGLLYGDGIFEVLRTWAGRTVDLAAHLARLHASAKALWIPVPVDIGAAVARTLDAVRENGLERSLTRGDAVRENGLERSSTRGAAAGDGEHRIRIVVTRGAGGLGAETASLGPGRTIVIVEPLGPQPAELSAAVVDWPLARRTGPAHKTLAYLDHIIARDLARAAGADEAIRLDADGHAVEGATSNLMAVVGPTVVTAPVDLGVLPGTMRARALAACADLAVAVREAALSVNELRAADELFVTSALRGVVPITRLDGETRAAGPITARIATAVRARLI